MPLRFARHALLAVCFSAVCGVGDWVEQSGERASSPRGWDVAWLAAAQVYGLGDRPPRLRQLAKDVRAALRRFRRQVSFALTRWHQWLPKLAMGALALLFLAAVHPDWWRAVRARDWRRVRKQITLALSVVLGLVIDRRTPAVAKLLLVGSVFYLVANRDLLWDQRGALGFLDDALVLLLTARAFVASCPDALVGAWARRVLARQERREELARGTQTAQAVTSWGASEVPGPHGSGENRSP